MAYGFRARDAAGNITVEYVDRLTRVLGTVETGTSNGSIIIPPADGTPFYALAGAAGLGVGIIYPTVSLSGRTLSWSFNFGASSWWRSVTIVYGVYS